MRISIVSVSCCNPSMRSEDQEYLRRVHNVLDKDKVEAQVKVVTISQANTVLSVEALGNLRPVFERHGAAMLPAMLIDDELMLYGGVPTAEKISEAIDKVAGPHGKGGMKMVTSSSIGERKRA